MFSNPYLSTECHKFNDCKLRGCGTKFAVAPLKAIGATPDATADLLNIEWWHFRQVRELQNLNWTDSSSPTEYVNIGDCRNQIKFEEPRKRSLSATLNWCKDDIAHCRMCRPENCVAYCYVECGEGLTWDLNGNNPDPTIPDSPIFADPIGAGFPTSIGIMVINSCGKDIEGSKCITRSINATILEEHEFNMCAELEAYDELYIPPNAGLLLPATA